MGTLDAYGQLTLIEMAKRMDPSGAAASIAEVLAEDNMILQDAVWQEANDTWANKTTRRAALPAGSWRKLNEGVAKEASRTIVVMDTIGMLETYSEVDKDIIDKAPNPKQARMDEARAFLEGLSQTWASDLMYGNSATTPEKFTGLGPRMGSLAATTNVIGQGGTGSDLCSVFIVMWGPTRVFLVFPKGSKSMGINHDDLGQVTLQDGSSNNYEGYRDHFKMECGLVIKDDRCISRLANIESTGSSNLVDEDNLIKLINRMPSGPKWLYCNDTVLSQMEILLKDKTNVNFTPGGGEGLAGDVMMRFRGHPVRKVEQLTITEAAPT